MPVISRLWPTETPIKVTLQRKKNYAHGGLHYKERRITPMEGTNMVQRCELCGKRIPKDPYIVKIASYAAYSGLEINLLDLTRDFGKEVKDLLKKIGKKSGKRLEKDICVGFEFVLCKKCRDDYIKDPLGKRR